MYKNLIIIFFSNAYFSILISSDMIQKVKPMGNAPQGRLMTCRNTYLNLNQPEFFSYSWMTNDQKKLQSKNMP